MNLLTDAVYWWAAGFALVAVGGGAWLTSRTPRKWWGVVLNAVTILVASALMATSMALVLNRSNGWFANTDDLLPSKAQSTAQQYGSADSAQPKVPITRTDRRDLPTLPAPGQRVQQVTIPTSVGKQSWSVTIILPKEYFEASGQGKAYPVLMAAHGFPGSPKQWSDTLDLRRYGDPLIASGKLRPFIAVVPSLTPGGNDTECIAGPDDARQLETWLSKDVPAWVKSHLRVSPEPAAWAWIGFSCGGWCAAMLTMRHPGTFANGVVLDGYFQPWWPKDPPAGLSAQDLKAWDLVELVRTKPPAVSLWVQTSRKDPQYFPRNEALFKAAKAPLSVTAIIDDKGGHNFNTWRPHVQPALTWLGKRGGFAP